jgi:hypothetical protein
VETSNLNQLPNKSTTMPLTYHFKPFPKPGEMHFSIESTSPKSQFKTSSSCTCEKDQSRCRKCRQDERNNNSNNAVSTRRRTPQASLSPVEEHTDPLHRQLTPKAIRDQRRAQSRVSVSAAFQSAVATEEYFPLYHSAAFARSNSDASISSSRSRSRRRIGSSASGAQSPTSSRSSSEQEQEREPGTSQPVSELAQTPVLEDEEENDLARRGS